MAFGEKMITLYNTPDMIPIIHYEANSCDIYIVRQDTCYYHTELRTVVESSEQGDLFK
jgi:hypothetical protein